MEALKQTKERKWIRHMAGALMEPLIGQVVMFTRGLSRGAGSAISTMKVDVWGLSAESVEKKGIERTPVGRRTQMEEIREYPVATNVVKQGTLGKIALGRNKQGRVFMIGAREARQDSDAVTCTFPINQTYASIFDLYWHQL